MEMASPSTADRVLLLGPLQVIQNGAQRSLPPSRKVRALLAYLAMAPRPVTRERLCELFWDVADDPRSELRWCLCKLRLAGQRHRFGQLRQQLLERLSAVLPPESDDRVEVLRECIEVAPFDEPAHIELIRTLLRRALYAEAEHQIDASLAHFQCEGVDPTSLKSALAAARRCQGRRESPNANEASSRRPRRTPQ